MKTWEELKRARLERAKERLVESEGRLAYMSPEDMSLIHEKVRASLADLEAKLVPIGEYASETQRFTVERAEIQLAETEVQLARSEAELLIEMIEFDMSISRETKTAIQFLAEEAVRLAEAEIRLVEAELQLFEEERAAVNYHEYPEAEKYLYEVELWLDSDEPARKGLSQEEADKVAYHSPRGKQMVALAAEAHSKNEVMIASMDVGLAKLKARHAEAKLQLLEAYLMLGEHKTMEV